MKRITVVSALFSLVACSHEESPQESILSVKTTTLAAPVTPKTTQTFSGTLRASEDSALSFEVSGKLHALRVSEGDAVRRGQVLAVLDSDRLRTELESAQAAVARARAARDLAKATLRRQRNLAQDDYATQQRLDDAVAALDQAQARLESTKAGVKTVEVQLAKSALIAPFDGVVTRRYQDAGETAGPDRPTFDVLSEADLEAVVGVPAHHARMLEPGQEVTLRWSGESIDATVVGRQPRRDRATRTVNLIIASELTLDRANPGDLVELSLEQTTEQGGHWIPLGALQEGRRGMWSVLVVDDIEEGEGVVHRRHVTSLYERADRALVRGSIEPGDRVVTSGIHRLVPGQRVALANDSGTAPPERAGSSEP